ncbi:hypothetical protein GCM10010282_05810 [Streptomyces roseolus]|nr:hypothetical protein GCM10010282_05810 [Streptomyces roseolus]
MGASGSRGCLERSAVTFSVGAFSSFERLRNTKPKGTGWRAGNPSPGGNDPLTAGVVTGTHTRTHGRARGLPEILLLLPPETGAAAVVLGEERIPLRTVR